MYHFTKIVYLMLLWSVSLGSYSKGMNQIADVWVCEFESKSSGLERIGNFIACRFGSEDSPVKCGSDSYLYYDTPPEYTQVKEFEIDYAKAQVTFVKEMRKTRRYLETFPNQKELVSSEKVNFSISRVENSSLSDKGLTVASGVFNVSADSISHHTFMFAKNGAELAWSEINQYRYGKRVYPMWSKNSFGRCHVR